MDFFTIAFSTFLGAAVALTAERLTRAHDAKLQEEAAVNNLILDLAAKRAFVVSDDWDWGEGERDGVVSSVMQARSLVRDARLALRARSGALAHLQQMTRVCNTFIESSERDDDEVLKGSLRQLAVGMAGEVQTLHRQNPRHILADPPGSLAF